MKNYFLIKHTPLLYLIFLLLPFVMFYWMVPFWAETVIGNDYPHFSIETQLELMFSLKNRSSPLFVPGFAGGQTASALTLGQMYHPLSHIASMLPGYWSGKALEWNTFLRLLTLGLAHAALFTFLRKLKINAITLFFVTTITVYNLRTLDLFRYGASLESWTGFIFLCSAIGWYCMHPEKKCMGSFLIAASTYSLVCSGHPQMMYYGLLGAGLFTLVIPFFIATLLPEKKKDLRTVSRFYVWVILNCGAGILLASAYIFPFCFEFMTTNAGRVANNYIWTNGYLDTFAGTLNNFFLPLRSDVNSVFGGSSIILIPLFIPALLFLRIKIPGVIWIILAILLVAFLHMQGARLPIHYFVWKYFPLASTFRVPGRISIIMPVFFMLAIIWVMQEKPVAISLSRKSIMLYPSAILSVLAMLAIAIYLRLPVSMIPDYTIYSATSIRKIPSMVEKTTLILGALSLASVALTSFNPHFRKIAGIAVCIFSCLQMTALLQYGTWIEKKKDTPTFGKMVEEKKKELKYNFIPGSGASSAVTLEQARRSFIEPFLAKIYPKYLIADNTEQAYSLMNEGSSADEVILEGYPHKKVDAPASGASETRLDRVKLVYSAFNRLIFSVETSNQGFLGLAYPFTGNWHGYINAEAVPVYRANGGTHAVLIPEGQSRVEFRYKSPSANWGMILSVMTFSIWGLAISFSALNKKTAFIIGPLFPIAGTIFFMIWYNSLYSGTNLNTEYTWTSDQNVTDSNIAYRKKTIMSSLFYADFPYLYSSGQAVDGLKKPGAGFLTQKQENPWWLLDLHHPQAISKIIVHEGRRGKEFNSRPVTVAFSTNGKDWEERIWENDDPGMVLNFSDTVTTRYIMIMASGVCYLSFDEVEVLTAAAIVGDKEGISVPLSGENL